MALTPAETAQLVAETALTKKAEGILILDLRQLSEIADFFVICSGDSDVQVRSIADEILKILEERGTKEWHVEGHEHGIWVLIDYIEVVVHIFRKEARDYYRLEDLWGDAPTKRVGDYEDTESEEGT